MESHGRNPDIWILIHQPNCHTKWESLFIQPLFPSKQHVPWSKVAILGMVIPPLIGILIMGIQTNPYYWVDDHPLLYGNNGSFDPIAHMLFPTLFVLLVFFCHRNTYHGDLFQKNWTGKSIGKSSGDDLLLRRSPSEAWKGGGDDRNDWLVGWLVGWLKCVGFCLRFFLFQVCFWFVVVVRVFFLLFLKFQVLEFIYTQILGDVDIMNWTVLSCRLVASGWGEWNSTRSFCLLEELKICVKPHCLGPKRWLYLHLSNEKNGALVICCI